MLTLRLYCVVGHREETRSEASEVSWMFDVAWALEQRRTSALVP